MKKRYLVAMRPGIDLFADLTGDSVLTVVEAESEREAITMAIPYISEVARNELCPVQAHQLASA